MSETDVVAGLDPATHAKDLSAYRASCEIDGMGRRIKHAPAKAGVR